MGPSTQTVWVGFLVSQIPAAYPTPTPTTQVPAMSTSLLDRSNSGHTSPAFTPCGSQLAAIWPSRDIWQSRDTFLVGIPWGWGATGEEVRSLLNILPYTV